MRQGRVSILFGGLTAIMTVALIQLLSVPELDVPLTVTMYAFSFALPMSAFYVISAQDYLKVTHMETHPLYELFSIITLLAGASGLAGIFLHFGKMPFAIFITTSFIAIAVLAFLGDHADKYFHDIKKEK
jgi:Na+/alanine symporter